MPDVKVTLEDYVDQPLYQEMRTKIINQLQEKHPGIPLKETTEVVDALLLEELKKQIWAEKSV